MFLIVGRDETVGFFEDDPRCFRGDVLGESPFISEDIRSTSGASS